jgi:hypothetical protein
MTISELSTGQYEFGEAAGASTLLNVETPPAAWDLVERQADTEATPLGDETTRGSCIEAPDGA